MSEQQENQMAFHDRYDDEDDEPGLFEQVGITAILLAICLPVTAWLTIGLDQSIALVGLLWESLG